MSRSPQSAIATKSKLERAQNAGPLKDLKLTAYDDMHKMFDDKSIDAVSN